ncbi:MAG: hypothetical protein A2544_02625 [Candidatus Zambryskibacteria bacterium RIFOXYD2_FULL_43_10]|uniref:DUF2231 domain-containing protein n=1 Tax=Candidatus Zambryskibacteria bacterium RIFOXYD2_FULL_43_10 TaxID=1802782 RepID=A0A1G2V5V6_9BACT|nr:MAG: hypothetical protein A2544_02625 [Candidatus Zambryskibacteria bacterium RIFOXYD2_FULL_43_10]
MDIHPLVIHYPIAFLTTYVVFELLRFRKLLNLPYWFYVKATLVTVGELGAIVTVIAAQMSPDLTGESLLIDRYKSFMLFTAVLFGIITLSYWFKWSKPIVIVPLVIIGLFFIVIAGGLFGATVYGTHFDPLLAPIFKLLKVY